MYCKIFTIWFVFQTMGCQNWTTNEYAVAANLSFENAENRPKRHESLENNAKNLIFQSADEGQNWADISHGLPENLDISCAFADENELNIGSSSGLFRAKIKTETPFWYRDYFLNEKVGQILPGKSGIAVRNYRGEFFQSFKGASFWLRIHAELKEKQIYSLFDAQNGTQFITAENGITKSSDGGKTWKQVFYGLIFTIKTAENVLLGSGPNGIIRSTDGGENWNWVLENEGRVRKIAQIDGKFIAITEVRSEWNVTNRPNKMLISNDLGKTWQPFDQDLSPARFKNVSTGDKKFVREIFDIKKMGETLFCSLNTGIFRSSDGGKTWKMVREGSGKDSFDLIIAGKNIFVVRVFDGC